jgi:hypothetical protein
MDFYSTVLMVAAIALIIMLVLVAYILYRAKSKIAFPPLSTQCPDYWDAVGQSCKVPINSSGVAPPNTPIIGGLPIQSVGQMGTASGLSTSTGLMSFNDSSWTTCAKYKFCKKYGLSWDGITNMNQSC